jgi:hypothetical protein
MSVNKSEKRTPASTASQTGFFLQYQSVMALGKGKGSPLPAGPAQERNLEARGRHTVKGLEPYVGSEPRQQKEDGILYERDPQVNKNKDSESSPHHTIGTLKNSSQSIRSMMMSDAATSAYQHYFARVCAHNPWFSSGFAVLVGRRSAPASRFAFFFLPNPHPT